MIVHTDDGPFRHEVRLEPPRDRGAGSPQSRFTAVLDEALSRTQEHLLNAQHDAGYWVGELEGDTILESEYILLMAFLGREHEPACAKMGRYLLEYQLPCGGWANYPGGPPDLSSSVKAYLALKLLGHDTRSPAMANARRSILDGGGAQACNSFTRFYLALLGQMSYDECPSVPPELALLPKRVPFGLYAMSSWTRKMVVTLSIISALRPKRELPAERGIAELFRDDLPRRPSRWSRPIVSWANFFLCVDKVLKFHERWTPEAWRRPAIRAAHRWVLDHLEGSDGLGAIFPPMIYTVIVLKALGYEDDSPLLQWALRHLEDLQIEEDETIRVQPCVSPVWDTAIVHIALADSGLPTLHPALLSSVRWLLSKEVRTLGDWAIRRPGVEPSGWYFEFNNEQFPDVDDTAMVLLALRRSALTHEPEVEAAVRRGVNWLLAMQNRDGGWAAFDADIDNQVLTKVPFADHNAMLDPSCADITARILELLGDLGYRANDPVVSRALAYLWKTQEPEGCWYGRWGVNYIYGTWQVLLGLSAIGFDVRDARVVRAIEWLESVQQPNGGWGETCASYDDPTLKGLGEPTASQTAWAVLGLIAVGRADTDAVRRGIEYLIETQNADGAWDEESFTGTGFPRVFYLRYHLYRVSFPLLALARYRSSARGISRPPRVANPGVLASRIPALPLAREV